MKNCYEVSIIHPGRNKDHLGFIEEKNVTHNRYNEGLLIGAGKLLHSDIRREVFCEHAAKYRNKAELEFKSENKTYTGTFCFFSFVPETHTVVFGSIGPVYEWCPTTNELLRDLDTTTLENVPTPQDQPHMI